MALLTVLGEIIRGIGRRILENDKKRRAGGKKRGYKEFDFDNIESVTLDGVETAYRTETREEFDPVMSYYLTEQDGWQHYETETVEYQVEDGENYLFTIKFKNGTEICRRFHESSWLAERLLEYCNKAGGDL